MSEQSFSPLWLLVLIPIGFLILFPIFWLFVIWVIGTFGGWRRLARRYRAQQPVTGKQWPEQFGFVGSARYGNGLNVTTSESGLLIEVVPLFNFNHPPLFIPWHELHDPQPVVFRQRELIQVDVGHPRIATLRLPPRIFAQSESNEQNLFIEASSMRTNVPTE